MNEDSTLLYRYSREESEPAFAELVRRHVNLVHGAALRRTGGDQHRAADVCQQVFTKLACEAGKLSRHPSLGAWLHAATRNAALNLMISEQRRKDREHQFAALDARSLSDGVGAAWEELRPVLDESIDELPEPDRVAVVMRFFEGCSFAQVGSALHLTEAAARMRAERALDKLRGGLARRGITSTSAALALLIETQALPAAPASLAATLTSGAISGASSLAPLTFLTLIMKTKTVVLGALLALLLSAIGFLVGRNYPAVGPAPIKLASARERAPAPPAPAARTSAIGNVPRAAAAQATQAVVSAITQNLRQLSAAISQFQLENGRPPGSLLELVGPDKIIRSLRVIDGEEYATVKLGYKQPLTLTSRSGIEVTFDPSAPEPPSGLSAETQRMALQMQFDFLSPEKLAQLAEVLSDFSQRQRELSRVASSSSVVLPEDREKLQQLEAERREALAAILSPDELFEYDLRSNATALMLRSQLQAFAPSDEEFRAIFRVRQAFDAHYGTDIPGPGFVSTQRLERQAHLPELEEQIVAVLGPERGVDYNLSQMPGAQQLTELVRRLDLPAASTRDVLMVQAEVRPQLAALRGNRTLSAQERNAQLAALQDVATSKVSALLGERGLEAYRQNGGAWLQNILPAR